MPQSSFLNPQTLFVRLLLAVLLAFGSEVLLWTNPTGRSVLEWLVLLPGYFVLSTALLDLMLRYTRRTLSSPLQQEGHAVPFEARRSDVELAVCVDVCEGREIGAWTRAVR